MGRNNSKLQINPDDLSFLSKIDEKDESLDNTI